MRHANFGGKGPYFVCSLEVVDGTFDRVMVRDRLSKADSIPTVIISTAKTDNLGRSFMDRQSTNYLFRFTK